MKKIRPFSVFFKLGLLFLLVYLTHSMPEARKNDKTTPSMTPSIVYQREHAKNQVS